MAKREPILGRADVLAPSNQELISRLLADVLALESRVAKLEGMFETTKAAKTTEW